MNAEDTFGQFFRRMRLAHGMGLRQFCAEHGHDPGNISKLERGKLNAPQDREKLRAYAEQLGLAEDSEEWRQFFLLADLDNRRIPQEILDDEALMAKLPVIFRTLTTQDLTREQLEQLVEEIRKE